MQKAFAEELALHGGTLLDGGRFDASRADFSDIIKQILQVHVAKGEPATHRTDVDFVFVEGSAGAARQIVPQLKFNYAGDVPVYSTSDSFEPDPSANADLDGMSFPDMPWMVSADPVTGQIRDSVRAAWPARTARLDRLYAFGFDAYRLVPGAAIEDDQRRPASIAGVTGKLYLDEQQSGPARLGVGADQERGAGRPVDLSSPDESARTRRFDLATSDCARCQTRRRDTTNCDRASSRRLRGGAAEELAAALPQSPRASNCWRATCAARPERSISCAATANFWWWSKCGSAARRDFGGALASVTLRKQRKIIRATRFLLRASPPLARLSRCVSMSSAWRACRSGAAASTGSRTRSAP